MSYRSQLVFIYYAHLLYILIPLQAPPARIGDPQRRERARRLAMEYFKDSDPLLFRPHAESDGKY